MMMHFTDKKILSHLTMDIIVTVIKSPLVVRGKCKRSSHSKWTLDRVQTLFMYGIYRQVV